MGIAKWFIECIPAAVFLVLLIWSYYTYIGEFCEEVIGSEEVKRVTYMTFYHLILLMVVWSYFKVMCTGIASVPYEFKLPKDLYNVIKGIDDLTARNEYLLNFCSKRDLVVVTRTEYGLIRYCSTCKHVKPDRAHHCSSCGTCVLRMDHHCPWVHNCIGFSNYKAFVLLLCYGTLYCTFYAGTTLEYFIQFIYKSPRNYKEIQVMIGFMISAGIGILIFSLFCYHISLISKNETTLETLKEPVFRDDNENLTFNTGICSNFTEVFGDNCFMWCIPEGSCKGDGIHFPIQMMF